MNFDFDDDQHEIKRTARDLLAKRSTMAAVREAAEAEAYDASLWNELVELGWPGIAIAEEHGGGGLGTLELAVLLEESGYALAGSPLLSTALAAFVIGEAGSAEQKAAWLPRLASGEVTGALGALNAAGEAPIVGDADAAGVIVLVEAGGASARLAARADADVTPIDAIDATRRYARVRAGGEPLPGDATAGVDRGLVAVAAELVGVAQRALDMTVGYVKDRKQFDTPVGAFQAVSHRCADMLMAVESARSATYFAAWAAEAAPERLREGAAMAKVAASDGARDVTAGAIQLHGGIGFTWEADVHWLFKRAQLGAALLGGASGHRRALAGLVGARA